MKSTVNHLQTSENRMKKESADSARALFRGRKLKVLVLSRSYPNNNFPLLGVWVENLVRHSARLWETKVVSPVPYCPPLARGDYFDRFRKTERHRISEGVEVFYPRFLMPPGLRLHGIESITYYLAVVRLIDRPPQGRPDWDGSRPDPASSAAPWKVYNIGNNRPEELMYMVSLLEQEFGRTAIKEMLPMQPGDVEATYADVAELERDIGFRPSTSIEDGIASFAKWYREHHGL